MNGPSSSITLPPFPSSLRLFIYVCSRGGWWQRTTCGIDSPLPPYHKLYSSQSQKQASTHLLSHLGLQGVAFLAFQTLALQLQTSHVLESRLKYHRPAPLPLTSRSTAFPLLWRKHLSMRQRPVCGLRLLLPPPTLGTNAWGCAHAK